MLPEPFFQGAKPFFYSENTGEALVGVLYPSGNLGWMQVYDSGAFALGWTHIVSISSVHTGKGDLFYYNSHTGEAAVGAFQNNGWHVTPLTFPSGVFRRHWSHVVYLERPEDLLLFYDMQTGDAEFGEIEFSGQRWDERRTPTGYRRRTRFRLGNGWTHVVPTGDYYLLLYCSGNGLATVLWLKEWFPLDIDNPIYREPYQKGEYGPYQLSPGWTHVVDGGHRRFENVGNPGGPGILFYRDDTGQYVVGDIRTTSLADQNQITTRVEGSGWSYSLLRPGWKNIAQVTHALLFYEPFGSRGMLAYLLHEMESVVHGHDPLVIKYRDYSFTPGGSSYTHLLNTANY